ncbi:MAG: MHS family MFS transporter [Acidimicrobiia bacterium]|nr:MHS family MFS transporter [Acidimicrobiia bacterium]
MSDQTSAAPLTQDERRQHLRRAVIASAVGTSIEWYDFFLYGVAAALVFPQKFFPQSDPFIGTLLAFSTFFVGFASRPIGAIIFGHLGDRIGRKTSLIATLLLMGISTTGIGLVPAYEAIGIWGAVLLTLGRMLQGIGVGGEWGGAVLMSAEWGEKHQRGLVASWTQFAAPAGLVLANGALALMTVLTDNEAFLAWGWRIPFLASVVLVGIGFYIRRGILETPVFAKMKSEGRIEKTPVTEAIKRNWREIILVAVLRTGQQTPFYIFTTYVLTYATQTLGYTRGSILSLVMVQALLSMAVIPWFGHLSDRLGRWRMTAYGCYAMIVFPFAYFWMLDSGSLLLVGLAIIIALPIHDLQFGPQAALIAEVFPSRLRYSGASLGYQLASITAGGPAPIVALYLFNAFGTSFAVAGYVAVTAIISLIGLWMLPDRSAHELDEH